MNLRHAVRSLSVLLLCLVAGSVGLAAPAARRAPATPRPEPAPGLLPKSVFDAQAETGRDPFFPKSARRPLKAATTTPAPASPQFPEQIRLNGVSGHTGKRLALINGRTFAAGEEGQLRCEGQNYKVRCEAVKETSALIIVNGVPRELHLREGL